MERNSIEELSPRDDVLSREVDLDEINFAVIDKGLGFHHKERSPSENLSTSRMDLSKQKLLNGREIGGIDVPTIKTDKVASKSEVTISEALGVDNNSISQESVLEVDNKVSEDVFITESSLEKVTAAWAVDLVLILLSIIAALILFIYATGIDFEELKIFMLRTDAQIFLGVFFTIFYLLYFSVLDLNSSPGKLLFGTKLISATNSRLTVFNTFTRAFIILFSIPLFLLPLIFGAHNKISGTLSVEENW